MRIEHIGLCIDHPISVAEWWVAHLGFHWIRKLGTDQEGAAFIGDGQGTVIEFGKLPEVPSLDMRKMEYIQLHLALECTDTLAEARRLIAAGASWVGESPRNAYQNEKVIVRDPWGIVLQLINRQDKLSEEPSRP